VHHHRLHVSLNVTLGAEAPRHWDRILKFLEVPPHQLHSSMTRLSAPKLSDEVPNMEEVREAMGKHFGQEALDLLRDDDLH